MDCECDLPDGDPNECGEIGGEEWSCPCSCHDDWLFPEPSP